MESKDMEILTGFLLYVLAAVIAGVFVAPYASFLTAYLSWAGAAAGSVFGAIVAFPIIIGTFYVGHRAGIKAAIPEAE
jgi:hypothetical protein